MRKKFKVIGLTARSTNLVEEFRPMPAAVTEIPRHGLENPLNEFRRQSQDYQF
jgi:hypothetical protein